MKKFLTRSLAILAVACLCVTVAQATDIGGDINGVETYTAADAPLTGNVGGDTHVRNTGVLTLDGVSLGLDSFNVLDGIWNKADGEINIINGGAIDRTKSGTSVSGGFFMLGSWSSSTASPIRMNVLSGSTFSNDGVVGFGMTNDSPALDVKLTIDGGSTVDLTGGAATDAAFPGGISNSGNAPGTGAQSDILFVNNAPGGVLDNNTYVINFNGPGTLITDNGIAVATQDIFGNFSQVTKTYEDLWNDGVLQVGMGNPGQFSDWFTVSGTAGSADYTLTSTIPEPASIFLAAMGLVGIAGMRRRR